MKYHQKYSEDLQFQAERCSLFLVDRKQRELVAKVFDGNMLPDGTVEVASLKRKYDYV